MVASEYVQRNRGLLPNPALSDRSLKKKELNKALKTSFGDR